MHENPEGMMGVGGFELFTLIGTKAGASCNFRAAYARPWEFTSFDEYQSNNEIIEFRLTVLESTKCNPDYGLDCKGQYKEYEGYSSATSLAVSFAAALAFLLF